MEEGDGRSDGGQPRHFHRTAPARPASGGAECDRMRRSARAHTHHTRWRWTCTEEEEGAASPWWGRRVPRGERAHVHVESVRGRGARRAGGRQSKQQPSPIAGPTPPQPNPTRACLSVSLPSCLLAIPVRSFLSRWPEQPGGISPSTSKISSTSTSPPVPSMAMGDGVTL